MNLIFLDFETYYDDEYSLRKMTPVEYVLDPRFECHGCAIQYGTKPAFWLDGDQLPKFFEALKAQKDIVLVTHNALFDMCIVAWRYGFRPRLMLDTMGMAQAILGGELRSMSLNSVAKHLGLGAKTNALVKVKGLPMEVIKQDPSLYDPYVEYAKIDVELCKGIFDKLRPQFPVTEMVIMDMILRCCIVPRFKLDQNLLAEHLHTVQTDKQALLAQSALVGGTGETLRSNDKFAELLRTHGVEPPTKISPVTGRGSYAFAKSDVAFMELLEHENPAVQVLVNARIGSKSTLEESRTERLLRIAQCQWPTESGYDPNAQWLPVPLKFSGAHTHRFSGAWSLNLQNLPTRGGSNALRRSLTAPDGYSVVTVDASQIQARLVVWLAGQADVVEKFANGEDVYSSFATTIFGYECSKATPAERFIGKTGILSLGFQVGWEKFQTAVKIQSKAQAGKEIDLADEEAIRVVNTYRNQFAHKVSEAWRNLQSNGINALANGGAWDFGPCTFMKNKITLPSGLHLHYPKLEYVDRQWVYMYGGYPKKTYGGHLLENLAQALERCAVMEAAIRIAKRPDRPCPLPLALQGHDELVYVVPTEYVPQVRTILEEEMSRRPAWAPDLPLAAESGWGPTYGDAK